MSAYVVCDLTVTVGNASGDCTELTQFLREFLHFILLIVLLRTFFSSLFSVLWKLNDIYCHMVTLQTARYLANVIPSGGREWRQLSHYHPARYACVSFECIN